MNNNQLSIRDQVFSVLSAASSQIELVAPYIKLDVLSDCLEVVRRSVESIDVYTKWSVMDVAAGATDPEIWQLAERDNRLRIFLVDNLHAKLYRGDNACLIGSANITRNAFGYSSRSNIEVLIEASANQDSVVRLRSALKRRAIPATADGARQVRQLADRVLRFDHSVNPAQTYNWLPKTRTPVNLYPVYAGTDMDLVDTVQAGVVSDLLWLDLQPALSESAFRVAVLARLRGLEYLSPLWRDGYVDRDSLVETLKKQSDQTIEDVLRAVESLASWLQYFETTHIVPTGDWQVRLGREY